MSPSLAFLGFLLISPVWSQTTMTLLLVTEENDEALFGMMSDALVAAEKEIKSDSLKLDALTFKVDRNDVYGSYERLCALLRKGVSVILDMTWTGWDRLRLAANSNQIIYQRGDCSINPYVQAMDDLLMAKNATDCGLIFEHERELNQSLYYLIGNSIIRLVVIDEFTNESVTKIKEMRPSPTYYVIFSNTMKMEDYFKTAIEGGLVKRNNIWNLVFLDNEYQNFRFITGEQQINVSFTIFTMKPEVCCRLIGEPFPCTCPSDFQIFPYYFNGLVRLIVGVMADVQNSGITVEPRPCKCADLDADSENTTPPSNATLSAYFKNLEKKLSTNDTYEYVADKTIITYKAELELKTVSSNNTVEPLATWTRNEKIQIAAGKKIQPAKRFFRIGTAFAVPWSTKKLDAEGNPIKDADGKYVWEGYCIDVMQKLSEVMNFDYEIVIPEDETFGKKLPNGEWNGLVGDLARGETDFVIGALTMTSEREEVVDFVAPYFEQSGILIVIRKPIRRTSLFKFMTVLRLEVWLSIVGALTLTGVMIWVLDKYSPYSARNNKRLYPYPCREFTLKESFWFALTSFTPQGGGEAPKALSSRTLVAAYWLFVVLMLATFTANLAAFLTVERMQSPVQSLEQLARQSRINYTVMENSSSHQYFTNMKKAEDKLYTMWKEITLNSTSDQIEYRVWDYPIKEQYGHILQAITAVGPVKSPQEGFKMVEDSDSAEFAFIHDSAEIKYEVTKNCNLTEIGEVFAEQPYAVAVQQGSHLQEEISRKILDLQKDRYFENLAAKYWNQTLKTECPNSDDNEGITLDSLGGVFIATLFGLALAMITLAGEVIYYRKRGDASAESITKSEKDGQESRKDMVNEKVMIQQLASKLQLKRAPTDKLFKNLGPPRVSHISVYPREFPFND